MRKLVVLCLLMVAGAAYADDPKYEYKDVPPPPPPDKPTVYKANVTLGLVWVAGNAQSIGTSGTALFSVKHYNNEFTFNGGYAYVQSQFSKYGDGGPLTDEKTTAENWLIKGRYDRYFLEKNTVFVSMEASGNPPAGYVYRVEPQVGYARIFWKSARQLFRGELGFDYTREHRVDGSNPQDVDYYSGRLFLFYENKFTPYASFSEGLEMLEAFNDYDAFRLNSLTSLSSTIYKNISLKLNFKLMFNNDPAPRPIAKLIDPATMMPPMLTGDDLYFQKVDTQLDLVLAITFL